MFANIKLVNLFSEGNEAEAGVENASKEAQDWVVGEAVSKEAQDWEVAEIAGKVYVVTSTLFLFNLWSSSLNFKSTF